MTAPRPGRPLRVLFLLFEGLPPTVIDSQVLQHARTMRERTGTRFEVWAFACSNALYAASLERREHAEALAGCRVRVFRGVRPAFPGSRFCNGRRIMRELAPRRAEFDLVHARTDYTASCAADAARLVTLPLLWDCRGDAVAEFGERYRPRSAPGRLIASWRTARLRAERRRAASACAGALFVSRPLSELCAEALGGKRSAVIPCVAPGKEFFFEPTLRALTRQSLGYSDAERVFVYSGSLAAYQRFDETVALFQRIHRLDASTRLLVLTPDIEAARSRMRDVPADAAKLMTVPFIAVNRYLNAADAAFLLRADTDVNRVASPTKLAEYCLTGLPVIMTDAVRDAVSITGELGNRLPPDPETLLRAVGAGTDRAGVAYRATAMLSREAVAPQFHALYTALSASRSETS